jgi:hypothetical protein
MKAMMSRTIVRVRFLFIKENHLYRQLINDRDESGGFVSVLDFFFYFIFFHRSFDNLFIHFQWPIKHNADQLAPFVQKMLLCL